MVGEPKSSLLPVDWRTLGYSLVAGVDEVGRGCLAGPVFSAAVIIGPDFNITGITDSKLIKPETRHKLALEIKDKALAWALGVGSVEEIEKYNILRASLLSMKRAVENLKLKPGLVVVDGREEIPQLSIPQKTFIKGDLRCLPISCASIVAKVARDELMEALEKEYPGYQLSTHKGYATAKHRELIKKLGPAPIHRKSFGGVKEFI